MCKRGLTNRMSGVLQRANTLSAPVASSQMSVSTSMRVPPMRRQVPFTAPVDLLFHIFGFADNPLRIFTARGVCKCASAL